MSEDESNTTRQVVDTEPSSAEISSKALDREDREPGSTTIAGALATSKLENLLPEHVPSTEATRQAQGLEQAENTERIFNTRVADVCETDDSEGSASEKRNRGLKDEPLATQTGADAGSKTPNLTGSLFTEGAPASPKSDLVLMTEGEGKAVAKHDTQPSYATVLARPSPVKTINTNTSPKVVLSGGAGGISQTADSTASTDSGMLEAGASTTAKTILEEHGDQEAPLKAQFDPAAYVPFDEEAFPDSVSDVSTQTQFRNDSGTAKPVTYASSSRSPILPSENEDGNYFKPSPKTESRSQHGMWESRGRLRSLKPLKVPLNLRTKDTGDADEPYLSATKDQPENEGGSSLSPYELKVLDLDSAIRSYKDSEGLKMKSYNSVQDMVGAVRAIASTFEQTTAQAVSDAIRSGDACASGCPFQKLSFNLLGDVQMLLRQFEEVSKVMLTETRRSEVSRSVSRSRFSCSPSPEPEETNPEIIPEGDEVMQRIRVDIHRSQSPFTSMTASKRTSLASRDTYEASEDSVSHKGKEVKDPMDAYHDSDSEIGTPCLQSRDPSLDRHSQGQRNVNLEEELTEAEGEDPKFIAAKDGGAMTSGEDVESTIKESAGHMLKRDSTSASRDDTKSTPSDSNRKSSEFNAGSAHSGTAQSDVRVDTAHKFPRQTEEHTKNHSWEPQGWKKQQPKAWNNPSWTAENVLNEHVDFSLPDSDDGGPRPKVSRKAHRRSRSSRHSIGSFIGDLALMGEEAWPFFEEHERGPDTGASWYNMDEGILYKVRKGVVWQGQRVDTPEAHDPTWKTRESHPLDKNGYLYDEQQEAWYKEDTYGWFEVRKASEDVVTPGNWEEKQRKQGESAGFDLTWLHAWLLGLSRYPLAAIRWPGVLFGRLYQYVDKSTLLQAGIRALRLAMLLHNIQMYMANKRERSTWLEANDLTRVHMLQFMHREPSLLTPGIDYSHALGWMDVTTVALFSLHMYHTCIGTILRAVSEMSTAAASWRSFAGAICDSARTEAGCFFIAILWRGFSHWAKDALTLPFQFWGFVSRENQAMVDYAYELGTSIVGLLVAWSYYLEWPGLDWLRLASVEVNGWLEFLYSAALWPWNYWTS
ncbi:hypothetical protein HJFPF1_04922 [Paramyrothecium foliicola]|nr:hypothetical protein HJFPF1_04922 [Paramyrothecium foliicola]